jgi:putative phage-type endonuclease
VTAVAAPFEVVLPADATREQWLAARRTGIGGSDAAAVLGLGGDPLRVYAEKTVPDLPEQPDTPAMRLGRLLEEPVAQLWAAEQGLHVRRGPALLRSTRWPWMLASVDRFVHEHARGGRGPVAVYEGKVRNLFAAREWDEVAPPAVVAQCVQYLAVTGLPRAYVGCLVGGAQLRSYEIERDDDLIEQVAETERLWWERHIEQRQVPEPSGHGAASLLAAIYRGGGPALDVTDDRLALGLIEGARLAKAYARATEAEADALCDQVRLLLGDHDSAEADGQPLVTWKPGKRTSVDVAALKNDHPDVYAQVLKTTTTRALLFKSAPKETP